MVEEKTWLMNSLHLENPTDDAYIALLYGSVIVGSMFLLHSAYLNGFKLNTIRASSDASCFAAILSAACYIGCQEHSCDQRASAYLLNITSNIFCTCLTQVADNYIVFSRYSIICCNGKVSNCHKYAMLIYVIFFLYGSWIIFLTLVPCGYNLNTPEANEIFDFIRIYCYFTPYVLFTGFYTGCVVLNLREQVRSNIRTLSIEDSVPLRDLAVKSIIHNVITCGGIACSTFLFEYGPILYSLSAMVSLHLLFNWKIEKAYYRLKGYTKVRTSGTKGTVNSKVSKEQTKSGEKIPPDDELKGVCIVSEDIQNGSSSSTNP